MKNSGENKNGINSTLFGELTEAQTSGLAFSAATVMPYALSILFLLVGTLFGLFQEGFETQDWYLYVSYLLTQLGFALVAAWYFFLTKKPVKTLVGKPSVWDFVLAIAMQFGLMFFLGGLNEWFVIILEGWGLSAPEPQLPSLDGFGFMGVLLVVAVLPAIFEETVFRGVVLNGLKDFPIWAAALLCGGMFSLFHQNPAQTIYQFFCGVAFALIALRSGSILPTVVAHFLNNAFILSVTKFGWQTDMLPILIASAVCFVGASAYLVYWAIKREKARRKESNPADKKGKWQFLLFALAGLLICVIGWVSQLLGA